jgi:hypothetical protein
MRDHILAEIRRLAAGNGGQPPGERLFTRETGIAQHQWRGKFWARWGDALTEAGYRPNVWMQRLDSETVLRAFAEVSRRHGRIATWDEVRLHRRRDRSIPCDRAMRDHFGGKDALIAELAQRARSDPAFADLAGMLADHPHPPSEPAAAGSVPNGFVYLIQAGDLYDLGRGADLKQPHAELAHALMAGARLIQMIRTDDPPATEAHWRRRFAGRRAQDGWFRLRPCDVEAFREGEAQ